MRGAKQFPGFGGRVGGGCKDRLRSLLGGREEDSDGGIECPSGKPEGGAGCIVEEARGRYAGMGRERAGRARSVDVGGGEPATQLQREEEVSQLRLTVRPYGPERPLALEVLKGKSGSLVSHGGHRHDPALRSSENSREKPADKSEVSEVVHAECSFEPVDGRRALVGEETAVVDAQVNDAKTLDRLCRGIAKLLLVAEVQREHLEVGVVVPARQLVPSRNSSVAVAAGEDHRRPGCGE